MKMKKTAAQPSLTPHRLSPMSAMKALFTLFLASTLASVAFAFALKGGTPDRSRENSNQRLPVVDNGDVDDSSLRAGVRHRREVLKNASLIGAFVLGSGSLTSSAIEEKIYSSNARNMARLSSGDSSGGSVYDNNPSSPRTRARRAMVGCKNSSARSLAGENIGSKNLSEKECNQLVMSGESDFMLGIGSR
ncbi:hypothetical protein ACHAWF_018523 [Thalassiosira exigua]